MSGELSNVLWALIGSVATIIVKKVLDMIDQGRSNRFLLRKLYFEKKLEAALITFSNFQKSFSLTFTLSSLYEMFEANKSDFNGEVFLQMNADLSKRLVAVGDAAQASMNDYALFFDVGGRTHLDKQLYQKFLSVCLR